MPNRTECKRYKNMDEMDDAGYPAGAFSWSYKWGHKEGDDPISLLIVVPGENYPGSCRIRRQGTPPFDDGQAEWEWDGDYDKPTIRPSILHTAFSEDGRDWHGWLTAGVLEEI